MKVFADILWGYQLNYPDDWVHRPVGRLQGFAAGVEALTPGAAERKAPRLLVGIEWNAVRKPVEPFWREHVARVAGMLGAKQVGAAPWQLGGGTGFEAEIQLPKRDQMRLWTGILGRGFTVLKFVVEHPLEDRAWFEPLATDIIRSLNFPAHMQGISATAYGLPLPPGYQEADPRTLVADIADPENWQAYSGEAEMGALQAFYVREAPAFGWQVEAYHPFPGDTDLGFARLNLRQAERIVVLGIMPIGEIDTQSDPNGQLVIKLSPVN